MSRPGVGVEDAGELDLRKLVAEDRADPRLVPPVGAPEYVERPVARRQAVGRDTRLVTDPLVGVADLAGTAPARPLRRRSRSTNAQGWRSPRMM